MNARLQPDEIVDVLLKGVRVVTGGDPSLEVVYRGGDGELYALYLKADSPQLAVTRVAPAEWPPKPGEVWADADDRRWFAVTPVHRASDNAWMVCSAEHGKAEHASALLERYGPMRRVYPPVEQAADVDQADEPAQKLDRRASIVAGLREIADLLESGALPMPAYRMSISGSLSRAGGLDAVREACAVLGVDVTESLDTERYTHWKAEKKFGEVELSLFAISREPKPELAAAAHDVTRAEEVAGPGAGPATAPDFDLGPLPDADAATDPGEVLPEPAEGWAAHDLAAVREASGPTGADDTPGEVPS